jgi:hypothetical protein
MTPLPSTSTYSSRKYNALKCLQINLRHSKLAAASLAEVILENELDMIFIQEPYAVNPYAPTLVDIPPGYIAFHSLNHSHAYGAALLIKLSLASPHEPCRAAPLIMWPPSIYIWIRVFFALYLLI